MRVEITGLRSPHRFANRIAASYLVDVADIFEVTDSGAVWLETNAALGVDRTEADRAWFIGVIESALRRHDDPTIGLAFKFGW
jgi:hypothetical protein